MTIDSYFKETEVPVTGLGSGMEYTRARKELIRLTLDHFSMRRTRNIPQWHVEKAIPSDLHIICLKGAEKNIQDFNEFLFKIAGTIATDLETASELANETVKAGALKFQEVSNFLQVPPPPTSWYIIYGDEPINLTKYSHPNLVVSMSRESQGMIHGLDGKKIILTCQPEGGWQYEEDFGHEREHAVRAGIPLYTEAVFKKIEAAKLSDVKTNDRWSITPIQLAKLLMIWSEACVITWRAERRQSQTGIPLVDTKTELLDALRVSEMLLPNIGFNEAAKKYRINPNSHVLDINGACHLIRAAMTRAVTIVNNDPNLLGVQPPSIELFDKSIQEHQDTGYMFEVLN